MSTVVCVTAPYHAPGWVDQRIMWLEDLGFDRKHRAFIHSKSLVYGDLFVDDRGKNVSEWKEAWPNSTAMMWERTSNVSYRDDVIVRVSGWDAVIKHVEGLVR